MNIQEVKKAQETSKEVQKIISEAENEIVLIVKKYFEDAKRILYDYDEKKVIFDPDLKAEHLIHRFVDKDTGLEIEIQLHQLQTKEWYYDIFVEELNIEIYFHKETIVLPKSSIIFEMRVMSQKDIFDAVREIKFLNIDPS